VVLDAQVDYLRREAEVGGYAMADREADLLSEFNRAGARLLNCGPQEVAFATNASEAWWRAFSAVGLEPGDRVLASRSEFVANGIALAQAAASGVDVQIVDNDANGAIDLADLADKLNDNTRLVCLTHVPMTSGLVNPAEAVGALLREHRAYYLVDACQSAGQLPVDVDAIGCDFLSLTGRKWLRGPRGTGLLYVRASVMDALRDPVFIDGRSADWTEPLAYTLQPTAQRYEFGEFGYAAKVGLGVAMNLALDLGVDAIEQRITTLADRLRAELPSIDGVHLYDRGERTCGNVTFTVDGQNALDITHALRELKINTAAPPARASLLDIGSHGIEAVVRVSPHYYNTEAEVDRFLEALATLA